MPEKLSNIIFDYMEHQIPIMRSEKLMPRIAQKESINKFSIDTGKPAI